MRILLIGLVLALAWAASASAGVVLRQNSDGSASWVTTGGGYQSSTPAGQHQFVVEFSELSTAGTEFVVLPFGGRLHSISAFTESNFTVGSPGITAYIMATPVSAGAANASTPGSSQAATQGNIQNWNQFTKVSPVAWATTGDRSFSASGFVLTVPLAYAATGRITTLIYTDSSVLDFLPGSVIAIHLDDGTATSTGSESGETAIHVTITVK